MRFEAGAHHSQEAHAVARVQLHQERPLLGQGPQHLAGSHQAVDHGRLDHHAHVLQDPCRRDPVHAVLLEHLGVFRGACNDSRLQCH